MNIDKIVKECPRAWAEWCKFLGYRLRDADMFGNKFVEVHKSIRIKRLSKFDPRPITTDIHYRELFDYFDSVGINVEVSDPTLENYWGYKISNHYSKNGYDSRTEAEYKAFERAFEIREKQIEQNSKGN